MSPETRRKCPKCGEPDTTGFKDCRFCGTKYNARINNFFPKACAQIISLTLGMAMIGFVIILNNSISKSIKSIPLTPLWTLLGINHSSSKPFLVELYTNWTGGPNGSRKCTEYNTIVEQCRVQYGKKVDIQRLNLDDPNNLMAAYNLGGHSLRLPAVYLFNRRGQRIAEFKDELTYAQLARILQDPKLFK